MGSKKPRLRSSNPRVLSRRESKLRMDTCKLQEKQKEQTPVLESTEVERQNKVYTILDLTWLAVFWSFVIVVMEKFKWVAAKLWGSEVLWITVMASFSIIIGEVLKYTAAKRLYKLFPGLQRFINVR